MDGTGQLAPGGPHRWKPDCIGRKVPGGAVAATRGRGGDALLAETDDHVPVKACMRLLRTDTPACAVGVRVNLARVEVVLVERIVDSHERRREMRTACKVGAHLANEKVELGQDREGRGHSC